MSSRRESAQWNTAINSAANTASNRAAAITNSFMLLRITGP